MSWLMQCKGRDLNLVRTASSDIFVDVPDILNKPRL
jgi:hypothetical protein